MSCGGGLLNADGTTWVVPPTYELLSVSGACTYGAGREGGRREGGREGGREHQLILNQLGTSYIIQTICKTETLNRLTDDLVNVWKEPQQLHCSVPGVAESERIAVNALS